MTITTTPTQLANARAIYGRLRDSGASHEGALGILGNFWAESRLDPTVHQIGGGPGRGLAQWSAGARWDTLVSWAKARGLEPLSLRAQVDFAVWEMKGNGAPAPIWNALTITHDVLQAATLVMRRFEMPADTSDANAKRRADFGTALAAAADLHSIVAVGDTQVVISRVLRYRRGLFRRLMSGPDVAAVQALVGCRVDRDFGPATAEHVRRWQAEHGLTADGVFGPQSTRAAGWKWAG